MELYLFERREPSFLHRAQLALSHWCPSFNVNTAAECNQATFGPWNRMDLALSSDRLNWLQTSKHEGISRSRPQCYTLTLHYYKQLRKIQDASEWPKGQHYVFGSSLSTTAITHMPGEGGACKAAWSRHVSFYRGSIREAFLTGRSLA